MFQVLISFLIWTWALESRNVKRQWFYWRRKLIELVVLSWKLLFHCPYRKQFRSKWKSPIHIMFVYIYRWWRLSRSNYYISGIHIDWVYFGGIHRNWVASVPNFYVFHLHMLIPQFVAGEHELFWAMSPKTFGLFVFSQL